MLQMLKVHNNTLNNILRVVLDATCPKKETKYSNKILTKDYENEATILKETFLKALHKYELAGKHEDSEKITTK